MSGSHFFALPLILSVGGGRESLAHKHAHTHSSLCGESLPNTRVLCPRTDYEERSRQLAKRGASTRLAALLLTFSPRRSVPERVRAVLPTVRCRAMSAKHFRTPSRCCCSPCLPLDPFAFPFQSESSARSAGVYIRILVFKIKCVASRSGCP